jgi:mannitol-1-phosphate 5-dehydrogenase
VVISDQLAGVGGTAFGGQSGECMSNKIVIFGAGAAGRGLVGLLFSRAGYEIVFVDIKDELVAVLREQGRYDVLMHGVAGGRETAEVGGFTLYHAADREAIAAEIASADLVLTAVFAQNLPDVARTLAAGVRLCRAAGRTRPLNCIACENMKNSSSTLRAHTCELLSEEALPYLEASVGFPDCMINRVVPAPSDPLHIETEDYCEWTLEGPAFKGDFPPAIDFIEPVDNQGARLDRKLMVYNGSHAATAYFGHAAGYEWIHEAVSDADVEARVRGVLAELATVVQRHHGFSPASMADYRRDFWLRCRNPGLRDRITRIARQPIRKLGRNERFIAPARLAAEYGLPRDHIVRAIAAALAYREDDDEQSMELGVRLVRDGLRGTLCEISGLEPGDPLLGEVAREWEEA